MQQLAKGAGWTRDYAYHTETKADGKVVYFDSKLLSTTVGPDTREYDYDDTGNLTSLGDDTTLAYNAHGLLQSVALAGGNSAIYRYDAGGGRVCKRVDARQTVAIGAWEGSGAVGEDGAWTRDEEFIAISDGVSVVLRVETSIKGTATTSAQRFELADQVNSRTVYLDGAGGVLGRREYLPNGAIALQSWSGAAPGGGALRWGFGGKRMDGETGLLDFGARMYAPWLGRWTACDPVVDLLGSPYGYCRGSPVSLVDPDGRWGVPVWQRRARAALDVAKGVARAAKERVVAVVKDRLENPISLPPGVVNPIALASAALNFVDVAKQEGLQGAANLLLNPAYPMLVEGWETKRAVERGDLEGAGYHGAKKPRARPRPLRRDWQREGCLRCAAQGQLGKCSRHKWARCARK